MVEAAIRLGGLAIALVQGLYLPITGGSAAISPPILALAAGMMAVAQAIRIDRGRRGGEG